MRCPRCGNDNPATNRFCGMCGATLLQTPVAVSPLTQSAAQSSAASSSQTAPSSPRAPAAPRITAPVSEDAPVVSGPSFLGLNRPDPRSRASLTIDPHASSSGPRNLDYLLDDDEEEEHHGRAGKFLLILLALALAGGLGYLRWRNQGFGWLGTLASKHPAPTQTTDGSDSASSASSSGDSSITPAPAAPAPATAKGTVAQPAGNFTPPAGSGNPAAAAPATPPSNPPAAGDATDANSSGASANSAPSTPSDASPATPVAKDDASSTDHSSADQPKAPPAPAPKPRPASKPSADSTIDLAREFVYGTNGVHQDCDRGLKLLKPVADAANPRAMIEMGALYSAGLCTPRDLPTAYRWFALALRKQPDNQAVQTDLQKLWGEMTQPERQLAIRLSQ